MEKGRGWCLCASGAKGVDPLPTHGRGGVSRHLTQSPSDTKCLLQRGEERGDPFLVGEPPSGAVGEGLRWDLRVGRGWCVHIHWGAEVWSVSGGGVDGRW